MSYIQARNFGSVSNLPIYNNDPLTYCMESQTSPAFNHSSSWMSIGQNSQPCQVYLATRCAQQWDGICEQLSDISTSATPPVQTTTQSNGMYLTSGDILLVNTAQKKYLAKMLGTDCTIKTSQFDPVSLGGSPYITYYVGTCYPLYIVDPHIIDSDPVMNKLLSKPWIAIDFFIKLKNSMLQLGLFPALKGTRLGQFYGI